jgi:CubicO group peptidase (beta-lactamase class C family)
VSRRPDLDAVLQSGLAEFPKDSKPRAIAAAIRVDGRLIWSSSDSIFPIYSITKTLTAICALRLCETHALALTDPVEKWLPHRKLKHDNVTLAHLLRHRSGLGDYGPLAEYHAAVRSSPGEPWTPQQFFDTVLAKRDSHEPDERFSYSNVGRPTIQAGAHPEWPPRRLQRSRASSTRC